MMLIGFVMFQSSHEAVTQTKLNVKSSEEAVCCDMIISGYD